MTSGRFRFSSAADSLSRRLLNVQLLMVSDVTGETRGRLQAPHTLLGCFSCLSYQV